MWVRHTFHRLNPHTDQGRTVRQHLLWLRQESKSQVKQPRGLYVNEGGFVVNFTPEENRDNKNKRQARRLRKQIERESRRTNRGEQKPCKHNRSRGRES